MFEAVLVTTNWTVYALSLKQFWWQQMEQIMIYVWSSSGDNKWNKLWSKFKTVLVTIKGTDYDLSLKQFWWQQMEQIMI